MEISEMMTKIGPELTTEPWRVVMRSMAGVAREAERAAREDKSQLAYHLQRIEYRLNMVKQLMK